MLKCPIYEGEVSDSFISTSAKIMKCLWRHEHDKSSAIEQQPSFGNRK